MFGSRKPRLCNSTRHDIKTFIRRALEEAYERCYIRKPYKITNKAEAERIKELINNPVNRFRTAEMIQERDDYWQEVDYRPSNLRRGFVFFFICNGCECPVRHLYRASNRMRYRCRECLNLSYYQPKLEPIVYPPPLKRYLNEEYKDEHEKRCKLRGRSEKSVQFIGGGESECINAIQNQIHESGE